MVTNGGDFPGTTADWIVRQEIGAAYNYNHCNAKAGLEPATSPWMVETVIYDAAAKNLTVWADRQISWPEGETAVGYALPINGTLRWLAKTGVWPSQTDAAAGYIKGDWFDTSTSFKVLAGAKSIGVGLAASAVMLSLY